jgi:hypothetical protein
MGSFWEVWEGLRSWREKARERFLLTFWQLFGNFQGKAWVVDMLFWQVRKVKHTVHKDVKVEHTVHKVKKI